MISPLTTAAAGSATAAMPGFGQTALSLLVVLGAIFALAAGLRRLQGIRRGGGGALRVNETLQLGPKERLLLVEAAGTHLLVGVGGNGQMQTLHVYAGVPPTTVAAADVASTASARPPLVAAFSEVLKRSLGKVVP